MSRRKLRLSRRQKLARQWLPLYEAADRIKELAPWDWMEEDDIFGVQDPETGEIGFVSVMGLLGEHLCIGVYLGTQAFHQFLGISDLVAPHFEDDIIDGLEIMSQLLAIPQMQASFENQDMVTKEDAGIMRRLKLNYSGLAAYPIFRSMHPGCPPVLLDVERIPFLIHVLEQTMDVAVRFEEDESLLYPDDVGDDETYLLRVASEEDGKLIWRDEIRLFPEPEPPVIFFEVEPDTYKALEKVPRVGNSVEIDLFMLPLPVDERGIERPFFPYSLLVADSDSGLLLSQDMLSPLPSMDAMYSEIPQRVVDLLLHNNILPYEIYTQRPEITALLTPVFAQLDVPVVEQPFLPMLDDAKLTLLEFLEDDLSGF